MSPSTCQPNRISSAWNQSSQQQNKGQCGKPSPLVKLLVKQAQGNKLQRTPVKSAESFPKQSQTSQHYKAESKLPGEREKNEAA